LLSLCMIVKNEEKNLPRCLESIKDIVDEIIIVDTGSTDSTIEIAEKYGAKIYFFEWNNNFSDARNFSLEKANGDWILIMDGDDELDANDKPKLIQILNHPDADVYYMQTLSYLGNKPGLNINTNLNIRLLRNHRGYNFVRAIHEQISYNGKSIYEGAKLLATDIKFYHYGYLTPTIIKQNKRERNINILETQLMETPNSFFDFFNIGNEYFALQDYETAIKHYQTAYEYCAEEIGSFHMLVFKMALTLDNLSRYDEELSLINKEIKTYPQFTELEFLKASLFFKQNKLSLAIKSFEKCLEMGESPLNLSYILGVGSYRSYLALAEIYIVLLDYNKAYTYYKESLKSMPNNPIALSMIVRLLIQKQKDMSYIKKELNTILSKLPTDKSNIVLANTFYILKKYKLSIKYLQKIQTKLDVDMELEYLMGSSLFYLQKFDEAKKYFDKIHDSIYFEKSLTKKIQCEIFSNNFTDALKIIDSINQSDRTDYIKIVNKLFIDILNNKKVTPLTLDKKETTKYLDEVFNLFSAVLTVSTPEIFEKSLSLLNLIDCDEVLLRLAKFYYNHGLYDLSYQEFIRSIKIFDKIDTKGLNMMINLLNQNN